MHAAPQAEGVDPRNGLAPSVVTVLGPDGEVRWISPTVGTLLGLTPEACIGFNALADIHPVDLAAVEAVVLRPADGPGSVVHRLRHADGHWVRVRTTIEVVPAGDEEIVLAISTSAAEEPATNEELGRRYRHLVESSAEHLAVSVDGTLVSASRPTIDLIAGGDPAALIGRSVFDFIVPASTTAAHERMGRIRQGEWPEPQLIGLRAVDGTLVDVEVSSIPTLWDGEVATQLTLRPRGSELAEIVRSGAALAGPDSHAVIITDLDLAVVSWNAAAEQLYGASAEDAVGRPLSECVGSAMTEKERAQAVEVLRLHGVWTGIAQHHHADGRRLDVLGTTRLVHDSSRHPIGLVAVNRLAVDTEQRAADDVVVADEVLAAIDAGQIHVHYQPIVRVADGAVVKVEALARWIHPERGSIPPGEFIPALERTPAVLRLGDHVLRTAVAQLARWRAAGDRDLQLSVNLSSAELTDPELAVRVRRTLLEHGVPASAVWFEVTETALAADEDAAVAGLEALRAIGVRLALDDFGTGFAHLVHLRSYPVQALKIDRSFVAGMHASAGDAAIVRSVIALARELDLLVVAEGVETAAQRDDLAALRCDLAQGFFFGRAEPAAARPPVVAAGAPAEDRFSATAGEAERIAALEACAILDTPREARFDAIAEDAAHLCEAPIAAVCFVDRGRIWFKATSGFERREGSRSASLADATTLAGAVLAVPDAAVDPRFAQHPFVSQGDLHGFLGAPIVLDDGHAVGAVWVADFAPRCFGDSQIRAIQALADQVAARLEVRRATRGLTAQTQATTAALDTVTDRDTLLVALLDAQSDVVCVVGSDGQLVYLSPSAAHTLGLDPRADVGRPMLDLVHPDDVERAIDRLAGSPVDDGDPRMRIRRGDGTDVTVEMVAVPYVKRDGSRLTAVTLRIPETSQDGWPRASAFEPSLF